MILRPNLLFHDRYRLVEMKGRGSFGEVWLAHDTQLDDMKVAIKIYIALDARGKEEFKAEYVTAFNLNHPNLLHAYHFEVFEDRPYLVMPYCPQSSTSLVGRIDEPTMWQFILDTASGLAYLHEKDILHRDIKPDNILVDESGKFLITDFGISVSFRSTLRQNSSCIKNDTGSIGGAIPYMAPELFGEDAEAVKASDIWALGVTLFELLTGELPFFGNGGVLQKTGAKIPKIKAICSDALKNVVKRCLAADGWDRPKARELVEIARQHLSGEQSGKDTLSVESQTVGSGSNEALADGNKEIPKHPTDHHENHTTSTDENPKAMDVGSVRFSDLVLDGGQLKGKSGDNIVGQDEEPHQEKDNTGKTTQRKSKPFIFILIALVVLGTGSYFAYKYFKGGPIHVIDSGEKTVRMADSLLRTEKNAKKGLDMLRELAEKGTERAEANFLLSRLFFDPKATNDKGAEFYSQDWESMRMNCGLIADNAIAHEHLMQAYTLKAEEDLDEVLLYELGCDYLYGRGTEKDWEKARWCFDKAMKRKGEKSSRYGIEIQKKLEATANYQAVKP